MTYQPFGSSLLVPYDSPAHRHGYSLVDQIVEEIIQTDVFSLDIIPVNLTNLFAILKHNKTTTKQLRWRVYYPFALND